MSSEMSNNNIEEDIQETIDADNLIKYGIDTIYQSFNENIEYYSDKINEQKRIINDLSKKLELMNEEIEMIQRENQYYKTQNEKLKKEIENLNKIINDIKGKLTKFDFKITSKKIMENINLENISNKNQMTRNNNYKNNYFKKDSHTIDTNLKYGNANNYIEGKSFENFDYKINSKTIRYDIKKAQFDDLVCKNNDLNNMDIHIENKLELNDEDLRNNFNNKINYTSMNVYRNQKKQSYNIFRNKTSDSNDMSNIKYSHHNTINIKSKNWNKNYNTTNIKLKKRTNKTLNISSAKHLEKKNNNINAICNNDQYENKNDIHLNNKFNEKNNMRSNSLNNVIYRKSLNNERVRNRFNSNRNSGKQNSLQIFNSMPLNNIDNTDCNQKFYQTYQKNFENNENINGGSSCLKELKMKEMTFFLKKCKVYMEQTTFDKVVKIFQEFQNGIITDEGLVQKINHYLNNNSELLNLFKNIIS